jgi:hypothetical protein
VVATFSTQECLLSTEAGVKSMGRDRVAFLDRQRFAVPHQALVRTQQTGKARKLQPSFLWSRSSLGEWHCCHLVGNQCQPPMHSSQRSQDDPRLRKHDRIALRQRSQCSFGGLVCTRGHEHSAPQLVSCCPCQANRDIDLPSMVPMSDNVTEWRNILQTFNLSGSGPRNPALTNSTIRN